MVSKTILSALARATLQSKLKVVNQRIAQLAKTFGPESHIYKQATEVMEKGAAEKYTSHSGVGPRGTAAKGNLKLDMRKITTALEDPKNINEVNEVLSKIAGIKVTPAGNIEELPDLGIKTIREVKKIRDKKLRQMGEDPDDYVESEKTQMYEDLLEMNENFNHAYDVAVGRVGESVLRKDPITSILWGENRTHEGKLTYREARRVHNRLIELSQESKDSALQFEADNGGNI